MTTYYGRTGGGNWSSAATWSLTSGGGATGAVPTAADDVILDANTGNITIDGTGGSPSLCKSLDSTGYTGTLSAANATQINLGNAAGGFLKLVPGMTATWNAGSNVRIVNTGGTFDITAAGKTFGGVTINCTGATARFLDTFACVGQLNLLTGTLNDNGQTVNLTRTGGTNFSSSNTNARTLIMTGTWTLSAGNTTAWDITDTTNITLTANGSTINSAGTTVTFAFGGLSYGTVNITGSGTMTVTGANTYENFNRTTTGNTFGSVSFSGNQTVTGTLTMNGNSVLNRVLCKSALEGTRITITAATVTTQHSNWMDIAGAGAGNWNLSAITGNSGDAGNNSGITFTAPTTCYAKTAVTANWSGSIWFTTSGGAVAARVPLPQDTAIFDANSITAPGVTISMNMLTIGSVDFTGVTNNPALDHRSTIYFVGSLTLSAAMTVATSAPGTWNWVPKTGSTFTSAGLTFPVNTSMVIAGAGSLVMQDNFTTLGTFRFGNGAVAVTGNKNITALNPGTSWGATTDPNRFSLQADTLTFTDGSVQLTLNGSLQATGLTHLAQVQLNFGTLTIGAGGLSCTIFNTNNSNTRTINMGSGTWTLTGTGTVLSLFATGLTLNRGTSSIAVTNTSASTKTLSCAGQTLGALSIAGAPSNGTVTITGNNTFADLDIAPDASVLLGNTSIQTLESVPTWLGTSGHLVTISSAGAGSATVVVSSGTVICDYLSLTRIVASGSVPFYAGHNSVNGGGNTNWKFGDLYEQDITIGYVGSLSDECSLGVYKDVVLGMGCGADGPVPDYNLHGPVAIGMTQDVATINRGDLVQSLPLGISASITPVNRADVFNAVALGVAGGITSTNSAVFPRGIDLGLKGEVVTVNRADQNLYVDIGVRPKMRAGAGLNIAAAATIGVKHGIETLGRPEGFIVLEVDLYQSWSAVLDVDLYG